uniref:HAT C-terminal dimerisation domain-containing protein n=1 Tax=Chromera velia CCMP2878 TaxID=1169474 RepID=A0A0G4F2U2_9ALVE|eukprot:Cvel_14950.t1-p1 / transcript=Cvel_14950.t1 / gene=Cvel_14950 / organism=Chromera_velia_CCMP2878 / gene_product=hypothetical protein / transcript_product=hypothetical protein / location=Cvel_scaffold1085:13048-20104(+) / protein_length=234 / sequence_SO=supercontig / SO=protein_coding / is_pseudo=false
MKPLKRTTEQRKEALEASRSLYKNPIFLPGTTYIVERLFSAAKLIQSDKCTSLDPSTFEVIACLKVNRSYRDIEAVATAMKTEMPERVSVLWVFLSMGDKKKGKGCRGRPPKEKAESKAEKKPKNAKKGAGEEDDEEMDTPGALKALKGVKTLKDDDEDDEESFEEDDIPRGRGNGKMRLKKCPPESESEDEEDEKEEEPVRRRRKSAKTGEKKKGEKEEEEGRDKEKKGKEEG